MTRKDYVATAGIIATQRDQLDPGDDTDTAIAVLDKVTCSMADLFERDNDRFDRDRFYAASGYPGGNQ